MDLGTGVAIGSSTFGMVGVFAVIMRFLSAHRDRQNGNESHAYSSSPSDYATREDIRNVEKRMDDFFSELTGKIETRMQEIRDSLKAREERCMGRAERIATIERAQQDNEQRISAVCRRSDVKRPSSEHEAEPGVIGFGKRQENGERSTQELFQGYTGG